MSKSLLLAVVPFLLAVSEIKAKPTLKISELGPKIGELVEPLRSTCVPRTGITDEAINRVTNGEFSNDPVLKAYMRCLLEESGVMDENGELIMDTIVDMIPPQIAVEGLKNVKICAARRKSIKDINDKTLDFFKCFYELNPDIFIFF